MKLDFSWIGLGKSNKGGNSRSNTGSSSDKEKYPYHSHLLGIMPIDPKGRLYTISQQISPKTKAQVERLANMKELHQMLTSYKDDFLDSSMYRGMIIDKINKGFALSVEANDISDYQHYDRNQACELPAETKLKGNNYTITTPQLILNEFLDVIEAERTLEIIRVLKQAKKQLETADSPLKDSLKKNLFKRLISINEKSKQKIEVAKVHSDDLAFYMAGGNQEVRYDSAKSVCSRSRRGMICLQDTMMREKYSTACENITFGNKYPRIIKALAPRSVFKSNEDSEVTFRDITEADHRGRNPRDVQNVDKIIDLNTFRALLGHYIIPKYMAAIAANDYLRQHQKNDDDLFGEKDFAKTMGQAYIIKKALQDDAGGFTQDVIQQLQEMQPKIESKIDKFEAEGLAKFDKLIGSLLEAKNREQIIETRNQTADDAAMKTWLREAKESAGL